MKTLKGYAAIEAKEANPGGVVLNKYADPIGGAMTGLDAGVARALASEDPGLIWAEVKEVSAVAVRVAELILEQGDVYVDGGPRAGGYLMSQEQLADLIDGEISGLVAQVKSLSGSPLEAPILEALIEAYESAKKVGGAR